MNMSQNSAHTVKCLNINETTAYGCKQLAAWVKDPLPQFTIDQKIKHRVEWQHCQQMF